MLPHGVRTSPLASSAVAARTWRFALIATVLTFSCTAILLLSRQRPVRAAPHLWTERDPAAPTLPALRDLNQALMGLTQKLLPAVVSLRVYAKATNPEFPRDHPPVPENAPSFGTGSGFIIRADGLMLTNHHVIENHTSIEVHLHNGDITTATVLGQDPVGDLALLRITADYPLPVAPLGRSAALRVGEFVVAIGSPFGFEHTITFGIVSAKKRHFLHSGVVGGFIQTDASINVGNSGGPLVNMRGEVIGLNTATVGRGELGFAIPIDAIKAVLPQLFAGQAVTRGWLGVQIRSPAQRQGHPQGLATRRGAYVHDVLHDQPAHSAGIQVGDIILRFDGQTVATPFDLQSVVAATPAGKTVQVEILRKQARQTLELTVGTMPLQR